MQPNDSLRDLHATRQGGAQVRNRSYTTMHCDRIRANADAGTTEHVSGHMKLQPRNHEISKSREVCNLNGYVYVYIYIPTSIIHTNHDPSRQIKTKAHLCCSFADPIGWHGFQGCLFRHGSVPFLCWSTIHRGRASDDNATAQLQLANGFQDMERTWHVEV